MREEEEGEGGGGEGDEGLRGEGGGGRGRRKRSRRRAGGGERGRTGGERSDKPCTKGFFGFVPRVAVPARIVEGLGETQLYPSPR